MNCKIAFAVLTFILVAAPWANGQSYIGRVLYPLAEPGGSTGFDLSVEPDTSSIGQTVGNGTFSATSHALLWTSVGPVDLNPTILNGISYSVGLAGNGNQQVGYGGGSGTNANDHALLWSGTAASAIDLNPTNLGFSSSHANDTSGTQQVGYGHDSVTDVDHALLWNGTAASAVDLNPKGFLFSYGLGMNGTQQVGVAQGAGTDLSEHAMLWNGTANSAVDLSPINLNGINESEALGTNGIQQVGYGYVSGTSNDQALLWNGTAVSAVDLNPSGYNFSQALSTNGVFQVGYGRAPGPISDHALLWAGTATSVMDLQTLLPSTDSLTGSVADYIDSSGNIYGFANNNAGGFYAVEWSPVPEPGTESLLFVIVIGILMRRRQRQSA